MSRSRFLTKIKKIEKKLNLHKRDFLVFMKCGDEPLKFNNKVITESEKEELIKDSIKRTGVTPHIIDFRLEFV